MGYCEILVPLTGTPKQQNKQLRKLQQQASRTPNVEVFDTLLFAKRDMEIRRSFFGIEAASHFIKAGDTFAVIGGERFDIKMLGGRWKYEFESFYDPFLKGLINENGKFLPVKSGERLEGDHCTLFCMSRTDDGNYMFPVEGIPKPLSANAVVNKKEGGSSKMNNEVTLQGKLVDEVELETSKNGKHFARGKLAIEQAHGEEVKTHTYPFTVFGAVAEQLADYKAGAQLEIAGQLNRDDYTNADGERRTSFSVVGREVKRPQEVGSKNAIKLSGFVQSQAEDGSLELKTSQDGKTQFVNFGLAVKRDSFHREGEPKPKAQYDTFYLTAFGEAAKQIVSGYHKGDLAEFHGSLNMGRSGISPIAASGKMIREASVVQDAQADRAAENENVQSAKSERVHTN